MLTRFFFCLLILSFFIAINMRSQVPITIKKKNFSGRFSNATTIMPLALSNWFKLAICITLFFVHSKQKRRIAFILWEKNIIWRALCKNFIIDLQWQSIFLLWHQVKWRQIQWKACSGKYCNTCGLDGGRKRPSRHKT